MDYKENNAYELIKEESLESVQSRGLLLRHKKSGARIVILSNRDENKVFSIGFRTPPCDNTGTPHIIEHTVLCGSRKFPLKDPFIELVKGSMNTFLNAMTYPDKTVYPVASCNDKDFSNLMDVYLDSVFYPNIYSNINIFRQEGWHYEAERPEDDLTINGVVYNEMKGAFSSPDSVLEREILRSLYPDTAYRYESGGDPAEIPQLTYEKYLEFHRTYYHPSNSYIYLYGDMDINERLEFLDREYLCHFDSAPVDSALTLQPPFQTPRELRREYPVSASESEEKNTYLSVSWSIGTALDQYHYIAFELLDYALLSSQGSPIRQALVEAGIGDDIYGGFDSGIYQPYFSVIAKHAEESQKEEFLSVIDRTLREQVEKGINRRDLLSALNSAEFKFREGDYGRFPKGLMIGLQLMDSWLYDENQPFLHLDELRVFDELRKKLDTDYYERLVQTWMIENPHRSAVTAVPKRGLNGVREAAQKEALKQYKDSLDPEEIQRLIRETEAVHQFGAEESTQEALRTIPMLSREDMKKEAEPFSNVASRVSDIPVLYHEYETNGIIYADLLFDLHDLPEELLPYAGIYRHLLGKLDTDTYTYRELTAEIGLHTGGVWEEINVYADLKQAGGYHPAFEARTKVLAQNYRKAQELMESILFHTRFTDKERISNVLAEAKSQLRTELSENGHAAGVTRALSHTSGRYRFQDLVSGIAYYQVLEDIVNHFEERWPELQHTLTGLGQQIFTADRLQVSVTCLPDLRPEFEQNFPDFAGRLYASGKRMPQMLQPRLPKAEGFTDASMIQYVTEAGHFDTARYPYHGSMRIFKSIMSFDYLWNRIRVKGGAYGCSAAITRSGDVYFTSYRDPKLKESLAVYEAVPEYLKNFTIDSRDMTKFVIGTFSEMDAPLSPAAKGRRSLLAAVSGLTWEDVQKEREEVLRADTEQIRGLADALADACRDREICVIGNEDTLKKEKSLFDALTALAQNKQENA